MAQAKNIVLRVRKPVDTVDRWQLRIRAEVDLPPELHGKIAAADARVPTIGFERLIVVPEDDIKTRLDVLSNLLL